MPRPRAPWWMYPLAASFVFYFAFLIYCERWRPRWLGIGYEIGDGYLEVEAVEPNSPAGRAGFKPGDRLVAVDGKAIREPRDWKSFRIRSQVNLPYRVEIDRAGERLAVVLTLGRRPGDRWGVLEKKRAVQFVSLVLALFLAFTRPHDPGSRVAAGLMAVIGIFTLRVNDEMAAAWRSLPAPLGALLWIPQIGQLMLFPLLFSFFAVFPRALFHGRWLWLLVWTPDLLRSSWGARYLYLNIYDPEHLPDLPDWFLFATGLSLLAYVGGGLVALGLNYRRLPDSDARRAVRPLLIGSVVGWLAALPLGVSIFWAVLWRSPVFDLFLSRGARLAALTLFTAFPLSFVYTILVRRRFSRSC